MDSKHTTVLSVSSNNIKNCKEIAQLMAENNIICSASPNYSSVCKSDKYLIENGCNITFSNMELTKIKPTWNILKEKYNLTCAHLHIPGLSRSCIYDFIRESDCPG
jgi:hypothetical protein